MKQISRSVLTIASALAFLGGVAAGNFFVVDWQIALAVAVVFSLAAFLFRKKIRFLFACLVLAFAVFGLARMQFAIQIDAHALAKFNDLGKDVAIEGIVTEDPDRRADHTKLTIEVETWEDEVVKKFVSGKLLAKVARQPEYKYGDRLQLVGEIQTPFETDEFSYRNYLARHDIFSVIYYPRIQKVGEGEGNVFFAGLYNFRQSAEAKLNQIFHEPHASLLAGLLVGSRRGIPPQVLEDFNTTGLTHIIAISGYNISILVAFVVGAVGGLVSRRWQFPLVAVVVISFTLFVGASPAVVRAAAMGLLAFAALVIGRQYHVGVAISLTAAVMVLINPRILLSDVSFQLSFAAVLGILYLAPLLEKRLALIPQKLAIRESLTLTLAATLAAAPLIVFYFDRFSLISPFANILVAPAIPLAMLAGFIALVVGAVCLSLGLIFSLPAQGLLAYILAVAEYSAKIPYASVDVGEVGIVLVVFYYILLGMVVWYWHRKNR